MKFQKKIIILGYGMTLLALLLFCGLQKAEYERTYDIDITNISDKTSGFKYDVDEPVDSDYIVISGYAYQVKEAYKSIDYKIVLLNQKTGKAFYVKTQPIERKDLVEADSDLQFAKVGIYGRISKAAGEFSENYYEICFLLRIDGEESIVHTGHYMGTPEENTD